MQRPIAVNCIQEKAPVPAWKTKPSWFLLAEEDRGIAPETQRYMAERMGAKIRTHHVDHTPMHTAEDELEKTASAVESAGAELRKPATLGR